DDAAAPLGPLAAGRQRHRDRRAGACRRRLHRPARPRHARGGRGHHDRAGLGCGPPRATRRSASAAAGAGGGRGRPRRAGGARAVVAFPGPGGQSLLATAGNDKTVRIWDPVTGLETREPLTGSDGGIRALAAFDGPSGRVLLATGGTDNLVRIWDPETGRQI